MKLITFVSKNDLNTHKIGAFYNDSIIDFSSSQLPNNMIDFINLGQQGLDIANDFIQQEKDIFDKDEIYLKSPILRPNKILAVGLNYKKHVDEAKELKDHHSNEVQLQEQYPNIFINTMEQQVF